MLRDIARVLDVPLAVLIDHEEAQRRQACPDEHEIGAVRQALRRYDVITNVFRPNGEPLPEPNLARLKRSVQYGWMASHLLDVTRGYLQAGQRENAAINLLDADQLASEEVRCRQLTREIMTDLVHSYPRGSRPSSAITTLARALGVAA